MVAVKLSNMLFNVELRPDIPQDVHIIYSVFNMPGWIFELMSSEVRESGDDERSAAHNDFLSFFLFVLP